MPSQFANCVEQQNLGSSNALSTNVSPLSNSREHFLGKLGHPKEFENTAKFTEEKSTEAGIKKVATIAIPEGHTFHYRYTYNGQDFQGEYSAVSKGSIDFNTQNTLNAKFNHTGLRLERGEKFTDSKGNTFYNLKVHIPETYKGAIEIDALYGKAVIFSDIDQEINLSQATLSSSPRDDNEFINQARRERLDSTDEITLQTGSSASSVVDTLEDLPAPLPSTESVVLPSVTSDLELDRSRMVEESTNFDIGQRLSLRESRGSVDRDQNPEQETVVTIEDEQNAEIDTEPKPEPDTQGETNLNPEVAQVAETEPEQSARQASNPVEEITDTSLTIEPSEIRNLLENFGRAMMQKRHGSLDSPEAYTLIDLDNASSSQYESVQVGGHKFHAVLDKDRKMFSMFSHKTLVKEITNNLKDRRGFFDSYDIDIDRIANYYGSIGPRLYGNNLITDKQGRLYFDMGNNQKLLLFDPASIEKSVSLEDFTKAKTSTVESVALNRDARLDSKPNSSASLLNA